MTDKEIRQLKRRDLLEIMIGQAELIDEQKEKIEQLEEKLHERIVKIQRSGSLAEAMIDLNDVLTSAEAAAEQYKENILANEEESRRILKETQNNAGKVIAEAEEKAAKIVADAEKKAKLIAANTEKYVFEMMNQFVTGQGSTGYIGGEKDKK